jgi:hypothetical protein
MYRKAQAAAVAVTIAVSGFAAPGAHAAASWRSVGPALTKQVAPSAASWRSVQTAFKVGKRRCRLHSRAQRWNRCANHRHASFMQYTPPRHG